MRNSLFAHLRAGAIALAMLMAAGPAFAADEAEEPRAPPPPLPEKVLRDPTVITTGEKLWQDQCTHCHGSRAYPGKAPKLQPRLYKPEFVWDRVYNGFRGMPPWKDAYSDEEVVAIVAYVMSDEFFP